MRKAITPIISLIVLLLISISLSGFAWNYLSGYYATTISKTIRLVYGSESGNSVLVMNIGEVAIEPRDLKVYINGEEVTRIQDDTFTAEGRFGFYVRAGIEGTETLPMVLRFDDLAYWDLDEAE